MTGRELDRQVRGELGTLSKENATQVARHLVMTFQLLDDNPQAALQHALAAQRRAGRVGLVREAAGLAAYRAGEYEQALRELRTARRLTGTQEHLPVMADCERGLGRPERALALAAGPEARQLDRAGQLELLMVAAGARQDLGQHDAAVVMLQVPELTNPSAGSHARLLSAYADALEAAGRRDEALLWLERAAAADSTGETGAAERLGVGDLDDGITDLLDDETLDDESVVVRPEPQHRGPEYAAAAQPDLESENAAGSQSADTDQSADTAQRADASEERETAGSGDAATVAAQPLLFSDRPGAPSEASPAEVEHHDHEPRS